MMDMHFFLGLPVARMGTFLYIKILLDMPPYSIRNIESGPMGTVENSVVFSD
jgi:hypothetical protein